MSYTNKISLIKDTIDNNDIDKLINWLKKYPRLTKGKLTKEFESKWSSYIGCKYSIFVNSGSSANLAMLYAVRLISEKKGNFSKNKRIIIPAVSWATDLAPVIQLGFDPYLCEASKETLGVDINHFEKLCKEGRCKFAMIVHVLGIPCQMKEIRKICDTYGVILLEDSCESVGSEIEGIKTGNFGLMSSFSFYFGHHCSTIEGGMICTNDKEIYELLKMIRSHGWDRDLDKETQKNLRTQYNITDFEALYTFYIPGFNIRSTDLQAFIGINQIDKLDSNNQKRQNNYSIYQKNIINNYWKLPNQNNFISNFAYPIIHPNRNKLVEVLSENDIECRPLICGSMSRQPFYLNLKKEPWKLEYNKKSLLFSETIHNYGLYLPNHPYLEQDDIVRISNIVNSVIGGLK